MGCDIHLFSEIKIDGEWHCYSHPDIKRCYTLFAKMAGVRNYDDGIVPLAAPRGIPSDASTTVKLALPQEAEHSFSWLSAAEIFLLEQWIEDNLQPANRKWAVELDWWGYLFGNSYGGFFAYPDDRPKGVEDVRFVFGFDS